MALSHELSHIYNARREKEQVDASIFNAADEIPDALTPSKEEEVLMTKVEQLERDLNKTMTAISEVKAKLLEYTGHFSDVGDWVDGPEPKIQVNISSVYVDVSGPLDTLNKINLLDTPHISLLNELVKIGCTVRLSTSMTCEREVLQTFYRNTILPQETISSIEKALNEATHLYTVLTLKQKSMFEDKLSIAPGKIPGHGSYSINILEGTITYHLNYSKIHQLSLMEF
jgi:SMC interacting uncharacterized protein involved in chromosome segregation